jgi:hypothetical protein
MSRSNSAIHGRGLTVDHIYKRVFCVKSGVMKIFEGISRNTRRLTRSRHGLLKRNVWDETIRIAIAAIYEEANHLREKPPNILEMTNFVHAQLAEQRLSIEQEIDYETR